MPSPGDTVTFDNCPCCGNDCSPYPCFGTTYFLNVSGITNLPATLPPPVFIPSPCLGCNILNRTDENMILRDNAHACCGFATLKYDVICVNNADFLSMNYVMCLGHPTLGVYPYVVSLTDSFGQLYGKWSGTAMDCNGASLTWVPGLYITEKFCNVSGATVSVHI